MSRSLKPTALLAAATLTFALTLAWQLAETTPVRAAGSEHSGVEAAQPATLKNTQADVDKKSAGCLTCHTPDARSMHPDAVLAGCTDCHGGNAGAMRDKAIEKGSQQFIEI